MSELSWTELVRRVHERANLLCEYCQTSQRITGQAMHVDHIDPDGDDSFDNLCLSCSNCNMSKARATSAVDPETGERVRLFNPRTQVWSEHFEWMPDGIVLRPRTNTSRQSNYTTPENQSGSYAWHSRQLGLFRSASTQVNCNSKGKT